MQIQKRDIRAMVFPLLYGLTSILGLRDNRRVGPLSEHRD